MLTKTPTNASGPTISARRITRARAAGRPPGRKRKASVQALLDAWRTISPTERAEFLHALEISADAEARAAIPPVLFA